MADRPRTSGGPPVGRVAGLAGLALICGLARAVSDAPVGEQRIITPREFGYGLGDTLEHQVRFDLAPGYRLDLESLPEPGRLTRWIALLEVRVRRGLPWGARPHAVTLVYQVVNEPKAVLGIGTPPRSLRVIGPRDDFPVILPAWGFTIAPITAPVQRPEGSLPPLRPPLPPPQLDTTARVARIALLCTAILGLAALLAYMHLVIPFLSRTRGPFSTACRRIEALLRSRAPEGVYAAALGEAHRAFNATAGRVVFEHELQRFFREHPRYEALRAPIEEAFAASTGEFFRGSAPCGNAVKRTRALLELCRSCQDRERGLA